MMEALKIADPFSLSKQQEEGEFWERIMEEAGDGGL
jgi:hypothetical protein